MTTGAPDPLYILARRVLLDALDALGPQREALILVGAQAVYLRTGGTGIAVAEHTTDGDIALKPQLLSDHPLLEKMMQGAGFVPDQYQVGTWITKRSHEGNTVDVKIDLLVPEALGGPGRRGARLGVHGNKVARKVKGLEAAIVDHDVMAIESLDPQDQRRPQVRVAGITALLVAKLHKIADRQADLERSRDKDALDVLRLLRGTPAPAIAATFRKLSADATAAPVSREAIGLLDRLFGKPTADGSRMAARAAEPLENPETITSSCAALAGDVLNSLGDGHDNKNGKPNGSRNI